MPSCLFDFGACAAGLGALGLLPYCQNARKRRNESSKVDAFCSWVAEARKRAQNGDGADPVKNLAGKTILALVNPNGGNGTAVDTHHRILEPMCKAAGVPVQLIKTEYAGHAQKIARETASASSNMVIVCLSGDGMLHDVVQGLVDDSQKMQLPIAVMPCGSSNGLAKSVYDSVCPVDAARAILTGVEHSANLISATHTVQASSQTGSKETVVGPKYDLVCLSHAAVVHVNVLAEIQLRWMNKVPLGGLVKDLLIALYEIGVQARYPVKVQIQPGILTEEEKSKGCYTEPSTGGAWKRCEKPPPGAVTSWWGNEDWYEKEVDTFFCETLNMPWLSYDFQMAPGLKPDEKNMDLIISRGHSRSQLFGSFMKVEDGLHVQDPWFERYRISAVAITPAQGNAFMMSGEFVGFDENASEQMVLATCHNGHARLWYGEDVQTSVA